MWYFPSSGSRCRASTAQQPWVAQHARAHRGSCCYAAGPTLTFAASGTLRVATGRVLLTREAGKNEKLQERLCTAGVDSVVLPMIRTTSGHDEAALETALEQCDWVVVTSPEAARVLLRSWSICKPALSLAVVGKGTAQVLTGIDPRLHIAFCPSKANAVTLAAELPKQVPPHPVTDAARPTDANAPTRVLYPASRRAATTLQDGLAKRGFQVVRLNTYDTVPVTDVAEDDLLEAMRCEVVCIASPSALKAWVDLVGFEAANAQVLACIGSTSGKAAIELGFARDRVFWDPAPGMDGFVRSVRAALEHVELEASKPRPEVTAAS